MPDRLVESNCGGHCYDLDYIVFPKTTEIENNLKNIWEKDHIPIQNDSLSK